ncbi:MAG TPA: DNA/RNA nuclease SfsA [Clostridia bacterium]|nr:DNA/RNA nuclease SfsA [Clostridia bacterium]
MKYDNILEGVFIERPHRFGAMVDIDGRVEYVHVKNTGRCRELLIPGVRVFLEKSKKDNRKTGFSLVSVVKGNLLINIDSQVPNQVVEESILIKAIPEFADVVHLKRESRYGNSRFDLYFERDNGSSGFIEVKGVTLDNDGTAMFPDAPTQRGLKHLLELEKAAAEGYEAYVFFLAQYSPAKVFVPNFRTDPNFSEGLNKVNDNGVKIIAYDSIVEKDSIVINEPIAINLGQCI